jgi:hypothetical protein
MMSFEHEEDASIAFMEDFSGKAVMLVDTYDTVAGDRRAISAARSTDVALAACGSTRVTCWIFRRRRARCSTRPA